MNLVPKIRYFFDSKLVGLHPAKPHVGKAVSAHASKKSTGYVDFPAMWNRRGKMKMLIHIMHHQEWL